MKDYNLTLRNLRASHTLSWFQKRTRKAANNRLDNRTQFFGVPLLALGVRHFRREDTRIRYSCTRKNRRTTPDVHQFQVSVSSSLLLL
jgi:hypothetical protein